MLHLAVFGALGRMGQRVIALANDRDDITVVAGIDTVPAPDAASAAPLGVSMTSELPVATAPAIDVAIDFTTAAATKSIARQCRERGVALVTGTTGLAGEQETALDEAAAAIPVLQATNFSLGVALLARLVRQAATVLGREFACEVVEIHHDQKVDAPSGTAVTLAREAAKALGLDPAAEGTFTHGRHGHTGKRPADVIGVHALRGGSVVGDHTVHLLGAVERLELTHRAESRDLFAVGALRAASWLKGRAPGRYRIDDMLADLLKEAR